MTFLHFDNLLDNLSSFVVVSVGGQLARGIGLEAIELSGCIFLRGCPEGDLCFSD